MVSPERHIAAMEKVNALVNVRERTIKEVRERLRRCDFSSEEIDDAIETALRVNLINEERYARAFIKGKTHSGWGRGKILRRLQESDIPEHVIQSCESEFSSGNEEYLMALRVLEKRSTHSKNPYATYMRRLINKGYSYEISQRAVSEHLSLQ